MPVALALAEAATHGPLPAFASPAEVRAAGLWWTCKSTRAKRELGWTTRPHEDTVEATVRWWEEQLGDRLGRRAAVAARGLAARRVRGTRGGGDRWPDRPLSRSSSSAAGRRPTGSARAGGWRGRCGGTATRSRSGACRGGAGERDDVDALTGQRVVPVLVLGREAVCDSRRILELLRARRG